MISRTRFGVGLFVLLLIGCTEKEESNLAAEQYLFEQQALEEVQACEVYACATSAEKKSNGLYEVWARGSNLDYERVTDYAQLRASEVTLENGRTHFKEQTADVVLHPGYLRVVLVIELASESELPTTADERGLWKSAQQIYDQLVPQYVADQ